jgi:hypothetical protein
MNVIFERLGLSPACGAEHSVKALASSGAFVDSRRVVFIDITDIDSNSDTASCLPTIWSISPSKLDRDACSTTACATFNGQKYEFVEFKFIPGHVFFVDNVDLYEFSRGDLFVVMRTCAEVKCGPNFFISVMIRTSSLRLPPSDFFGSICAAAPIDELIAASAHSSRCSALDLFEFPFIRTLDIVDPFFLFKLRDVESINLSALAGVSTIGKCFLAQCRDLQSIDLNGLQNVQTIGCWFLANCARLRKIDLTSLKSLKSVHQFFIANCFDLCSIKLTECTFARLQFIFDRFISGTSIKELQISLPNVCCIGNDFLSMNPKLTCLHLNVPSLTKIQHGFLKDCNTLSSLDLSSASELAQIGNEFLSNCIGITDLSNLNLPNGITQLGSYAFSNSGLQRVICTELLPSVTTIGDAFFYKSLLCHFSADGLQNCTVIGDAFLAHCHSLTSADLSGLTSITAIPDDFLKDCVSLTSLNLSGMTKVTRIGNGFLVGCSSLKSVDLSALTSLKVTGTKNEDIDYKSPSLKFKFRMYN